MDFERLKDLKELLEDCIDEDVKKMTAKDRLTIYLNLMEFYIPKMQRAGFKIQDDDDKEIKIINYGSKDNEEF